MRDTYPGTDTPITSPFYLTKCRCGRFFLRMHPRMEVTCPQCGRKFKAQEDRA